ncbi:hypothetical protein [Streptomyces violascens]|uniref:hypothetical protein n=1 Tax=Streptomyces violascens TaxID=67381 RepID=UPI003698E28E
MPDDQLLWETADDSPCAVQAYRHCPQPQEFLAECRECELCSGCSVHECYRDSGSALLHMDWFRDFASPGEAECGQLGGPANQLRAYRPRPCQLPAGHDGKHRSRTGWSWPLP